MIIRIFLEYAYLYKPGAKDSRIHVKYTKIIETGWYFL